MHTYRYGMLLTAFSSVLLLSACHHPHHPDPWGGYDYPRDHRHPDGHRYTPDRHPDYGSRPDPRPGHTDYRDYRRY